MTDPKAKLGYVSPKYLETITRLAGPLKRRSYEIMELHGGQSALDVGCGTGIDTIALAQIVGASGHVVGVDHDEEMLTAADAKAREAGVSAWVTHEKADAAALPFADNTFDASRSERLFQHVLDPTAVLAEMSRVTKPGGRVVVVDTDHSSLSIDVPDPAAAETEWALRKLRVEILANGFAGRQLYRLFKTQGLQDVTVEIFPFPLTEYSLARYFNGASIVEQEARKRGLLTDDAMRDLDHMLRRTSEAGTFFCYINALLVVGRKP